MSLWQSFTLFIFVLSQTSGLFDVCLPLIDWKYFVKMWVKLQMTTWVFRTYWIFKYSGIVFPLPTSGNWKNLGCFFSIWFLCKVCWLLIFCVNVSHMIISKLSSAKINKAVCLSSVAIQWMTKRLIWSKNTNTSHVCYHIDLLHDKWKIML